MKLEILDDAGNVVDTLPASKRRGLNRVEWSMRIKPPVTPPAAQLAFNSTQGPRVLPGRYTVRLTKGGETVTMPLDIGLDRRATFTVADRKKQFEAAQRVSALFGRMSALVAGLNAAAQQSAGIAEKGGATKPLAMTVVNAAATLKQQLVATKEGGAITGEERLREHMDNAYGAIMSVESAPTNYQLARVDVLERELGEVEAAFTTLKSGDLAKLNVALGRVGQPGIDLANVTVEESQARGGPAAVLARGLIGTRFIGSYATLSAVGEKD